MYTRILECSPTQYHTFAEKRTLDKDNMNESFSILCTSLFQHGKNDNKTHERTVFCFSIVLHIERFSIRFSKASVDVGCCCCFHVIYIVYFLLKWFGSTDLFFFLFYRLFSMRQPVPVPLLLSSRPISKFVI